MLQMEVLMGPTDKTAADAESTFANNYGAPPTRVFNPQVFTLPPMPNAANDEVWVDLDTPTSPT